jgi:hypothetical protein
MALLCLRLAVILEVLPIFRALTVEHSFLYAFVYLQLLRSFPGMRPFQPISEVVSFSNQ